MKHPILDYCTDTNTYRGNFNIIIIHIEQQFNTNFRPEQIAIIVLNFTAST